MNVARERCHSFVANNAAGQRVVIDVFRSESGQIELETESGLPVSKLGEREYTTADGVRLTSDDPEAH